MPSPLGPDAFGYLLQPLVEAEFILLFYINNKVVLLGHCWDSARRSKGNGIYRLLLSLWWCWVDASSRKDLRQEK